MRLAELAAEVTGEGMATKYTGNPGRPSRAEIARLAYQLFEMHGRQDGYDVDDWLAAERQLAHHYR